MSSRSTARRPVLNRWGLALAAGVVGSVAVAQDWSSLGFSASPEAARWSGWIQADAAYTTPSPSHFSNLRTRGEIAGRGAWVNGLKWKLSAQVHFDAAYAWTDHYPRAVRHDMRSDLTLREAYVDFSRGDWEFRLGKQNIVWGEMVGLFFADVVSAKGLREFVLPEFDQIRTPQWAARAEWFGENSHFEVIWLPAPEGDDIGEPGGEFFPLPMRYPGVDYTVVGAQNPSRKLAHSGFGVRWSTLLAGWDLSAFVYRSPDTQPGFRRTYTVGPQPLDQRVVYQPGYQMATRVGGTVSQDFDGIVFKAEAVYTRGREFSNLMLDHGNGLIALDTLDWAVGLDLTPWDRWRVNVQIFQRAFLDYDPRIGMDDRENGASLLVSRELSDRLDAQVLSISSLNRSDRLIRAMLSWEPTANTRLRAGVDVFSGPPLGMFGRFAESDRVWAELRYSF